MKKKLLLLIISMITCIVLFSCSKLESPSENLSVTITPAENTISIGESFQLLINIIDVSDLFGITVEVVFDPDILEVPEEYFIIGSFWDDLQPITCTIHEADRLNIGIVLDNNLNDQPVNGSGVLFSVFFKGIAEGESSISIENLTLVNKDGNPVEGFDIVIIKNATIVVSSPAV
ncbi:MAG: hypothetical protein H8D22_04480 [Candidatus Cloacimonetes bacterium]|nr:hypothetical protein [Candidatus Cloacimonadota bacterium]